MKRKNIAEEMFNDVLFAIREKQDELEKAITEYTSNDPKKLFIDVMENREDITIKIDLPGVKKEHIKIFLTEDVLEINAQFAEDVYENNIKYIKKERKSGAFSRVIELPDKVKVDESSSKFENGVLIINLPKIEKKETFQIKID